VARASVECLFGFTFLFLALYERHRQKRTEEQMRERQRRIAGAITNNIVAIREVEKMFPDDVVIDERAGRTFSLFEQIVRSLQIIRNQIDPTCANEENDQAVSAKRAMHPSGSRRQAA